MGNRSYIRTCSLLLVSFSFFSPEVPVFKGYEAARYQKHDRLISRLVKEFNGNRLNWTGCTTDQLRGLREITPGEVKAHMIQETGGNDARSRAAWEVDPLQVNVPGDWSPYKRYLGLKPPRHRNDGTLQQNLKAGIMWLARKGYGISAQPAANRPEGCFDGWHKARERYNGRSDLTSGDIPYSRVYADRIEQRADAPDSLTPIEIRKK